MPEPCTVLYIHSHHASRVACLGGHAMLCGGSCSVTLPPTPTPNLTLLRDPPWQLCCDASLSHSSGRDRCLACWDSLTERGEKSRVAAPLARSGVLFARCTPWRLSSAASHRFTHIIITLNESRKAQRLWQAPDTGLFVFFFLDFT